MYSGITPQAVEEHCSGLDWGGLRQTDLARDWDVGGSVDGFGDFSAQLAGVSLSVDQQGHQPRTFSGVTGRMAV
ncbi:MAG TPA: hypothetical protein VF772_25225, partial [Terriglobales bacterium]